MNTAQRTTLFVAAGIIALMCLCPPAADYYNDFIYLPIWRLAGNGKPLIGPLLAQIASVLAIAWLLVAAFKPRAD